MYSEFTRTSIEDPRDHFLTKTYEGGSYDEQPVKVGFRPDLVWIKNRSGQHSWSWCDSATHGKYLKTNSTDGDAFSDSVFRGMGQLGFNIGSLVELIILVIIYLHTVGMRVYYNLCDKQ